MWSVFVLLSCWWASSRWRWPGRGLQCMAMYSLGLILWVWLWSRVLILTLGFPMLVRQHLYTETGPWSKLVLLGSWWIYYCKYRSIQYCKRFITALQPSDAVWHQRSYATLAQVMACGIITAKPLPEPLCWLIVNWTSRTTLVKF